MKMEVRTGIGHTRWASRGPKTMVNAHPHCDSKSRIAVVHNGSLDNFEEARASLEGQGVKFKSETDSEVIAQQVGIHFDAGLGLFKPCLGHWVVT